MRRELAPYVEAVKKVAAENNVPLLDLNARSIAFVEKLGPQGIAPLEPKVLPAVTVDPKTENGAPAGDLDLPAPATTARRDGTHLNGRGSIEFGAIVAEELRRVLPETVPFFR